MASREVRGGCATEVLRLAGGLVAGAAGLVLAVIALSVGLCLLTAPFWPAPPGSEEADRDEARFETALSEGATPARLVALVGEPALRLEHPTARELRSLRSVMAVSTRRTDPPGCVWVYDAAGGTVYVYFGEDGRVGGVEYAYD